MVGTTAWWHFRVYSPTELKWLSNPQLDNFNGCGTLDCQGWCLFPVIFGIICQFVGHIVNSFLFMASALFLLPTPSSWGSLEFYPLLLFFSLGGFCNYLYAKLCPGKSLKSISTTVFPSGHSILAKASGSAAGPEPKEMCGLSVIAQHLCAAALVHKLGTTYYCPLTRLSWELEEVMMFIEDFCLQGNEMGDNQLSQRITVR